MNDNGSPDSPQCWRLLVPHDMDMAREWYDTDDEDLDRSGFDIVDLTPEQADRLAPTLHDIALTSGPYWVSFEESGEFADASAALGVVRPRIPRAFDDAEREGLVLLADALETSVSRGVPLLFDLGGEPVVDRPEPVHPTGDRHVLVIHTDDVDGIHDEPGALWGLLHMLPGSDYDMVVVRDRMDPEYRRTPYGELLRSRMESLARMVRGYGVWCVVNAGVPLRDDRSTGPGSDAA